MMGWGVGGGDGVGGGGGGDGRRTDAPNRLFMKGGRLSLSPFFPPFFSFFFLFSFLSDLLCSSIYLTPQQYCLLFGLFLPPYTST